MNFSFCLTVSILNHCYDRVKLMKLDTEGYECNVVRGFGDRVMSTVIGGSFEHRTSRFVGPRQNSY